MKRKFQAVIGISSREVNKVGQLLEKVITGLTENAVLFTEPDPTIAILTAEKTKLNSLIGQKDGSKVINQQIMDQGEVCYSLLRREQSYVNKVADGDRSIILLSGFASSEEPTTREIPGKAVIKRIEDGRTVCSAKIYAEKCDDADRYKVEITTTPNEANSWRTVLDPGTLFSLEIDGLVRGQELFIRITGGNNHGWGIPSEFVSFIPR